MVFLEPEEQVAGKEVGEGARPPSGGRGETFAVRSRWREAADGRELGVTADLFLDGSLRPQGGDR